MQHGNAVSKRVFWPGAALFVAACFAHSASAATPRDPGFVIERYLESLGVVTALAFAPDGTLFLTEKNGLIKVLPLGVGTPRVFAQVPVFAASECGLLGLALDPTYTGFAQGGFVYVFATISSTEQQVLRYRDVDGTGTDPVVIRHELPTLGEEHDGGCLMIGPDGSLYVSVGDGGSGSSKSQDVTSLFGKILRLNLDGTTPGDNPDLSSIDSNFRREIYAYGFRNPFRMAIRRTGAGTEEFELFVNDVGSAGSSRREEVNLVKPGRNYGWPEVEGIGAPDPRYENPLHDYSEEGEAIVGGVFYQGAQFPAAYRGSYFYMDYSSNTVFRMTLEGDAVASTSVFADAEGGLLDIAEGPDGMLYYSTADGEVYRIRHEAPGNVRPTAILAATPLSGSVPLDVAFDAGGSSDADGTVVRYDWSFGDGASLLDGGSRVRHEYRLGGEFIAIATVRDDKGGASSAVRTITAVSGDSPPAPEILEPSISTKFDGGALVRLVGRAPDAEDGELPGSSLKWDVLIVHPHHSHTHPLFEDLVGAEQSFELPSAGLAEAWNVTVVLTATDSKGQRAEARRLLGLNLMSFQLESEPTGLIVKVEGAALVTPASFNSVNGAVLEVSAPSPQDLSASAGGPGQFAFESWSDGGERLHPITVREGLRLKAIFRPDPLAMFLRGDSNRDGKRDISDAVFTLSALFLGGPLPRCRDAADANDDGDVNISDPVATLNALFAGQGPLPEPSTAPGFDPTVDGLGCE